MGRNRLHFYALQHSCTCTDLLFLYESNQSIVNQNNSGKRPITDNQRSKIRRTNPQEGRHSHVVAISANLFGDLFNARRQSVSTPCKHICVAGCLSSRDNDLITEHLVSLYGRREALGAPVRVAAPAGALETRFYAN